MKTYQFIITILEASDEFWEQLNTQHKDGIKEIAQDIQQALNEMGYIHNNVELKEYTNEEEKS